MKRTVFESLGKNFKVNKNLMLLFFAFIFYFLIKIPFTLSVLCTNENEGFYFIYGKCFLDWKELVGGVLFTPIFSFIIKFFGFGAKAIIAVHFLQTLVIILVGILLYFNLARIFSINYLATFAVIFWLVLFLAPYGASGLIQEILNHLTFEAEPIIILYTLCFLLSLINTGIFNIENSNSWKANKTGFYFLTGLFSALPLTYKANGIMTLIALVLWIATLFLFEKKLFLQNIKNFSILFFGITCGILLFGYLYYFYNPYCEKDSFLFFKNYFTVGYYEEFSFQNVFLSLKAFMFRYSDSKLNFTLFALFFLISIWNLIKRFILNFKDKKEYLYWILISYLSLGYSIAVILPGKYEPYYYHLIWPFVSMQIFGFIEEIKSSANIFLKKVFLPCMVILLLLFSLIRIVQSAPLYFGLIKEMEKSFYYNQPISFEDPVNSLNPKRMFRESLLKVSDEVNLLLPDKKSTFYYLNFYNGGITAFTPLTYIYSKRYSPSLVLSGLLQFRPLIELKLQILKKDLIERPPEILIISEMINLHDWQLQYFPSFFEWLKIFLQNNYKYEKTLGPYYITSNSEEAEYFYVYKLKKD